MKKWKSLVNSVFVIIIIVISAQRIFSQTYSLEKLIEEGLKNSKQIKTIEQEIAKVDAQIFEAYGSALPSLDFSGNYQYAFSTFNPIASKMPSMGGGPSIRELLFYQGVDTIAERGAYIVGNMLDGMFSGFGKIAETDPNTIALTLSVKQPLYAQGKVGIGLKIAKIYKESLVEKYKMVQDTIRASITKLFYAALLAQKNVTVQEEALKLAQEIHRLTVVRFSVGKASELDTLVSRLGYEQSLINRRTMLSQLRVALEALVKNTGIAGNPSEIVLVGEFPDENFSITIDEARSRMMQNNRALKQLECGKRVQEQLLRLARSDVMPMIYCGASVGKIYQFDKWSDIEWGSKNSNDQKVFIGLTMNLFNGFKNIHKIKQAIADKEAFELSQKLAYDGLDIFLTASYEKLEVARVQLESSNALVVLAAKSYSMAKVAYEIGTMTLADFQKRELDLANARLAQNAAQFAFHSAVVDIKLLMGEF